MTSLPTDGTVYYRPEWIRMDTRTVSGDKTPDDYDIEVTKGVDLDDGNMGITRNPAVWQTIGHYNDTDMGKTKFGRLTDREAEHRQSLAQALEGTDLLSHARKIKEDYRTPANSGRVVFPGPGGEGLYSISFTAANDVRIGRHNLTQVLNSYFRTAGLSA